MDIIVNVILNLTSISSWMAFSSPLLHKNLVDQSRNYQSAISVLLNKQNLTDKLILREKRLQEGIQMYNRNGTPKLLVDACNDLNNHEKADLYNDILMRAKGRKGKNNPYLE